MRRFLILPVLILAVVAVWLWGFGGAGRVTLWAATEQHNVQNAMAGALRRLRAGDVGAVLTLWGLCFSYGVLHAAGPGHGKLVIGGYGLGARVPALRLGGLAIASSLAQAATAVLLVYAGVLVFGLGREALQGLADGGFQILSNLMIAGIGLWLAVRGLRHLRAALQRPVPAAQPLPDFGLSLPMPHSHTHTADAVCESCGHAHGPTVEQAAEVRSLRDAVVLIAAIAARPCTGALFLLVLCWRMGIDWAGIGGAFVMGLGTATVTLVVAFGSVAFRESALAQAATGPGLARMLVWTEVLAGLLVLALATQMTWRAI